MGRRWAAQFVELATRVSRVVVGASCERSVYMNLAFVRTERSRTRSVCVCVCVCVCYGGGTLEVRPLYLRPRLLYCPYAIATYRLQTCAFSRQHGPRIGSIRKAD